jgi:hypothetical protein
MPVIYMRHPIHGTKVATMDLEAEEDAQPVTRSTPRCG